MLALNIGYDYSLKCSSFLTGKEILPAEKGPAYTARQAMVEGGFFQADLLASRQGHTESPLGVLRVRSAGACRTL